MFKKTQENSNSQISSYSLVLLQQVMQGWYQGTIYKYHGNTSYWVVPSNMTNGKFCCRSLREATMGNKMVENGNEMKKDFESISVQ